MPDEVEEFIMTALITELDVTADQECDSGTQFAALGLDSLVLVELAVLLRRRFGVSMTDEDLQDAETVGAASALVRTRLAERSAS